MLVDGNQVGTLVSAYHFIVRIAWPHFTSWQRLNPSSHPTARIARRQMFNRSGPRLVDALEFLFALFWDRPDLMTKAFPYEYL